MQSFNTNDGRHNFSVDGREFFIPAVSIGDAIEFSALAELKPAEQAERFADILASKVRPVRVTLFERIFRRDPVRGVMAKLSIQQKSALFKEWASTAKGTALGESSGSAAV